MKKRFLVAFLGLTTAFTAFSQEVELTPVEILQQTVETHEDDLTKIKKLKVSGYFQPQFQWGEQSAALRVGTSNKDAAGKSIEAPFNRVGMRRGRLKFVYDDGNLGKVEVQFNVIDKPGLSGATVQLKTAIVSVNDPWFKTMSFSAGVMDRPFGHEVPYSSSALESPERSRIINALFPEESDLGGMFVLQAPKTSDFNFIKFEGGLFAGNAINPETDNRKDFIGHLSASKPIGSSAKWGFGASYYNGGVYQTNSVVYSMNGNSFSKSDLTSNLGAYAKREYIGVDGQFSIETPIGLTQVRAEYILGTQPGTLKNSGSPNRSALPSAEDTYIRPMNGWYGVLIQDLGTLPLSAVVKYDIFDPNSNVSGNEVGAAGSYTSSTDIKFGTLGLGMLWRISPNIKMQFYYEIVKNETSSALSNTSTLSDYSKDLKDNMITMRIQYKF